MKITDLPNELLYKIIEEYNTECKSGDVYEYIKILNKRNHLYRLFHLQKPRAFYKKYYNTVMYDIKYNKTLCCDKCEDFQGLRFFKKTILYENDEDTFDYGNKFCEGETYKICEFCFESYSKLNFDKVLDDLLFIFELANYHKKRNP